jgi:threonyl-tRNA synthetase
MKKKGIIALFLCFVMLMGVLTSCSKPKTIEEYIKNDSEAMEEVQQAADSAGLNVDFSGNDVIYTYDLSTLDGVTEEVIKSDLMIEQLTSALDSTGDTFAGLCKELEEQSKIEGVQIVVNYTYGDEVIVTKTFNSSGAVN